MCCNELCLLSVGAGQRIQRNECRLDHHRASPYLLCMVNVLLVFNYCVYVYMCIDYEQDGMLG